MRFAVLTLMCAILLSRPAFAGAETLDVPYITDGNQKHGLDVYAPPDAAGAPVVIFIHGGAWYLGDRKDFSDLGRTLAANGIVAVLPSYRLFPSADVRGQIADLQGALAWTRQHVAAYGGDPRRVFLSGHSTGAYFAMLFALNRALRPALPDADLRGVIAFSGRYNVWFIPSHATLPETRNAELLFGQTEALRRAVSPDTYVSKDIPPVKLFCGGDQDDACYGMELLAQQFERVEAPFTMDHDPSASHLGVAQRLVQPQSRELNDLLAFVHAHTE
ncbi:MAG: alpha/beta hydrolase [Vulcanimicrobiaceae bacterium]